MNRSSSDPPTEGTEMTTSPSPENTPRVPHPREDAQSRLRSRLADRADDERGDVPGWVLVTVMTAGIVAALLRFAEPELVNILRTALASVTPSAGS